MTGGMMENETKSVAMGFVFYNAHLRVMPKEIFVTKNIFMKKIMYCLMNVRIVIMTK